MKYILTLFAASLLAASSGYAAVVAYTVNNNGTALTNGVLLGSNGRNPLGPAYNGILVDFKTGSVSPYNVGGGFGGSPGIFGFNYLIEDRYDFEGNPIGNTARIALLGSAASGTGMNFAILGFNGANYIAKIAEGISIGPLDSNPVGSGYSNYGGGLPGLFVDAELNGSATAFGPAGGWANPVMDNSIGYVGLQFLLADGASYSTHYGYAKFDYDDISNRLTLLNFGYESTPGAPILAGATVPEPSQALLLGLGCIGGITRRRRVV